jgi:mannosyl-oligosaccharide glucosidase
LTAHCFCVIIDIRHGCEERDGFEKYGWLKHDGRKFGSQELKDTRNNVELTTEFIKVPGGNHGGSWAARISGKPIRKGEPMSISTLYYIGLDGEGQLNIDPARYVRTSSMLSKNYFGMFKTESLLLTDRIVLVLRLRK